MTETEEPWWKEYRRNQYKPRKVLSMEMIIRKSWRENIKDYLNNCSFAGLGHVLSDYSTFGIKFTIVWLLLFSSVMVALGYCMSYVYSTLSNPLVVSLESSTYPISEVDFPAVALCNINRISKSTAEKLARRAHSIQGADFETARWLFTESGRLVNFEYDEEVDTMVSRLDGFYSYGRSQEVQRLMESLAPNCSQMLVRCFWDSTPYPCNEMFTLRRTIRGHCCTFNYLWKWDVEDGKMKNLGDVHRQHQSGLPYGLTLVLDPKIDDYAYSTRPKKGIEVLLFDPWHYPDPSSGRVTQRYLEPNQANLLVLTSRTQYATAEVRKYAPSTRNCLFADEGPDVYGGMYSMSTCLVLCRMAAIQALCQCIPYFMPALKGHPMCTLVDLYCLNKHKEKLMYLRPKDPETWDGLELELRDSATCPQCYPDCEHTQHVTKTHFLRSVGQKYSEKYFLSSLLEGLNTTDLCVLSVYQGTPDSTLNRLDVVYYWFEFLSGVGGFGGVMLGFCLLCLVELVYFLLVRFFYVFRINYEKYLPLRAVE